MKRSKSVPSLPTEQMFGGRKINRSKSLHNISSQISTNIVLSRPSTPLVTRAKRINLLTLCTGSRRRISIIAPEKIKQPKFEIGGKVHSGTRQELLQYLFESDDWDFNLDFICSFQYFINTEICFEQCLNSYNSGPESVRRRVLNIFHNWVDQRASDFLNNQKLMANLINFLNKIAKFTDSSGFHASSSSPFPLSCSHHGTKNLQSSSSNIPLDINREEQETVKNSVLRLFFSLQKKSSIPLFNLLSIHSLTEHFWETLRRNFSSQLLFGFQILDWLNKVLKSDRSHNFEIFKRLIEENYLRPHINPSYQLIDEMACYSLLTQEEEIETTLLISSNLKQKKYNFYNVPTIEMAKQFTLFDMDIFQRIEQKELYHKSWSGDQGKLESPHVHIMISRFNLISNWISSEILRLQTIEERRTVLKRAIKLAKDLYDIGNYNSMMAIISSLSSGPVSRLTDTWKNLPKKESLEYEFLCEMMNPISNFKMYREVLRKSSECGDSVVPYLGMFLKDLTFIEDGNKTFLDEEEKVINFEKMRLLSQVFSCFNEFKRSVFHYQPVIEWQLLPMSSGPIIKTEEEMYSFSYSIRPKDSKSEKKKEKRKMSSSAKSSEELKKIDWKTLFESQNQLNSNIQSSPKITQSPPTSPHDSPQTQSRDTSEKSESDVSIDYPHESERKKVKKGTLKKGSHILHRLKHKPKEPEPEIRVQDENDDSVTLKLTTSNESGLAPLLLDSISPRTSNETPPQRKPNFLSRKTASKSAANLNEITSLFTIYQNPDSSGKIVVLNSSSGSTQPSISIASTDLSQLIKAPDDTKKKSPGRGHLFRSKETKDLGTPPLRNSTSSALRNSDIESKARSGSLINLKPKKKVLKRPNEWSESPSSKLHPNTESTQESSSDSPNELSPSTTPRHEGGLLVRQADSLPSVLQKSPSFELTTDIISHPISYETPTKLSPQPPLRRLSSPSNPN